jgi:hypothetical protein
MMKGLFSYGLLAIAMCMVSCSSVKMDRKSLAERVDSRDYPSAFMAWYNIDMPEYPVDTEENRIKACAKHDPKNPVADEKGYVAFPNVNVVEEMTNMISASRSYQTNVEVMNTAKTMLLRTLSIGQG